MARAGGVAEHAITGTSFGLERTLPTQNPLVELVPRDRHQSAFHPVGTHSSQIAEQQYERRLTRFLEPVVEEIPHFRVRRIGGLGGGQERHGRAQTINADGTPFDQGGLCFAVCLAVVIQRKGLAPTRLLSFCDAFLKPKRGRIATLVRDDQMSQLVRQSILPRIPLWSGSRRKQRDLSPARDRNRSRRLRRLERQPSDKREACEVRNQFDSDRAW